MKKIEAIIRKTKFEEVSEALYEAGIEFFSFWDVRGVGQVIQSAASNRQEKRHPDPTHARGKHSPQASH